jgi:transcriptional regulator with XRE-family HTH domain
MKEVREWHSLSQAALSRRLQELGHTIDRERIAKLETTRTRPTLDDVLAIAVVLDVSPLFLIVPDQFSKLRIGKEAIPAVDARNWIRGRSADGKSADVALPHQSREAFAAQQPADEIPSEFRDAVKAYRPPKEAKKR